MSFFIKQINIDKVRHLSGIDIYLGNDGSARNLILTGKNGSGKTSVLEAIVHHLDSLSMSDGMANAKRLISKYDNQLRTDNNLSENQKEQLEEKISQFRTEYDKACAGVNLIFSITEESVREAFENGKFILAYYDARHRFFADEPQYAETVSLKDHYSIKEKVSGEFIKYMLNLKASQAFAVMKRDFRKERSIDRWFEHFTDILRDIYEEKELMLLFDDTKYRFDIEVPGKNLFDLNTAADGYSAIIDIISDVMLRMTAANNMEFTNKMPGIVIIDEIETHLHLSMQKKVLKYLNQLFPNIQFIVSTHSPFVLVNAENAYIYDLERRLAIENGLSDVSYSGVVDSYFEVDQLSDSLRNDFDDYKNLIKLENPTGDERVRIRFLENRLDKIPDFLMLNFSTEYRRLKLEYHRKKA